MPAHRLLTDAEEGHVTKAYLAGQSAVDIAAAWDVNPDTVRNIVRRNGGTLRSRGKQAGTGLGRTAVRR